MQLLLMIRKATCIVGTSPELCNTWNREIFLSVSMATGTQRETQTSLELDIALCIVMTCVLNVLSLSCTMQYAIDTPIVSTSRHSQLPNLHLD